MPVRPHSRRWELAIVLNDASETPRYLQIARSISADILDGRLSAGEALPGSRTLAHTLGVHRNAVLAGYTELVTEGWLRTEIAGGTFVSDSMPVRKARPQRDARRRIAHEPGYLLERSTKYEKVPAYSSGTLVLAKGAPDRRLLPVVELARAYGRCLRAMAAGF